MFHNGTKDCLGIHSGIDLSVNSDLVTYLQSHPGHRANPASLNVAVVIDNLSISLLHRDAPYTCQTLARLRDANINGIVFFYAPEGWHIVIDCPSVRPSVCPSLFCREHNFETMQGIKINIHR